MEIIKKIVLLLILCSSLNGFADTIDGWRISYNNKSLGNFNQYSTNISYKLIVKNVKEKDIITLSYGTDTPCNSCTNSLIIKDEKGEIITAIERKGEGNLSVLLNVLTSYQKKKKNNEFKFYYVKDYNKAFILVFKLKTN